MKKLLITLVLANFILFVSAQKKEQPALDVFFYKQNTLANNWLTNSTTSKFPGRLEANAINKLPRLINDDEAENLSVIKGPGVYYLPLDNMPCVVPDINAYNMPVVTNSFSQDEGIYAPTVPFLIPRKK